MPSRPVLRRLVAASCCLLVLAGVSTALGATATDCRTGVRLDGTWQRLTRPQFPTPPGVQTQGLAVAYAVDPRAPFRIVITDGTSVLASDDAGCSWAAVLVLAAEPSAELPLSGRTSRIVGLVVTDDSHPLAVLRDASVSPARPRVLVGTPGRNGRWRLREQGLPAAGEPGVVAAGPGAVAYLAVTPPPEVPAATSPLPAPVPPARPRVMAGTPGRNGRWRLREQGLPAAGEPGVVAAGPGAVAYLAVTPPPEVPAATSPLPAPVPLPAPDLPALPGG
ncbi:MAG: hypothetical protein H7323_06120, partial [Frankiales bacterium]|nr:hypothetical protein [Frankiales bacterium]